MPAFLPPLSDDALALLGCTAALLVSVLTVQLVHFVRHRKRQAAHSMQSGRTRSPSSAPDAARPQSLHDSAA